MTTRIRKLALCTLTLHLYCNIVKSDTYSRHISANERIIYQIHDSEVYVVIVELGGHYGDK